MDSSTWAGPDVVAARRVEGDGDVGIVAAGSPEREWPI
jgi:hypothetical protein